MSNNLYSNNTPILCPFKFYSNCKNSPFKCSSCCAYTTDSNDPLLYNPHDSSSLPHPASSLKKPPTSSKKPIDKSKSKWVKNGYKQEDKLIQKSMRSGAKFNDGDLFISNHELRIDSKLRHTDSKTFSLRSSEYKKGLRQGVEAWVITHKDSTNKDTSMVILSYELFLQLINNRQ